MRIVIVVFAAMLFTAIVTTAAQTRSVRERNARWTAPADQDTRTNPLADRPELEAGGKKVFHQRCSTCHGDDARGTARGPDLTARGVQSQSDGALFWKITSGNTRTGMPTFSFLPAPQRWQLVMHVRSHGQGSSSTR